MLVVEAPFSPLLAWAGPFQIRFSLGSFLGCLPIDFSQASNQSNTYIFLAMDTPRLHINLPLLVYAEV